jgi:hypothetical protein
LLLALPLELLKQAGLQPSQLTTRSTWRTFERF